MYFAGAAPELPPLAVRSTCRYCRVAIKQEKAMPIGNAYWDAVEPQPGVPLSNECPSQPISPGVFGPHEPE